ncbi:MAG: hypothetical protein AAGH87_11045 [Pseudomonadota bacterium]
MAAQAKRSRFGAKAIGIGAVVLAVLALAIGLGVSATRSIMGALSAASAQGEISRSFVTTLASDWNSKRVQAVWSSEVPLDQRALDELMAMGRAIGPVSEPAGEANCTWRTHTGTGALNGTFIDCDLTAEHVDGAADYRLGWRKENDVYQLYNLRIRIRTKAD